MNSADIRRILLIEESLLQIKISTTDSASLIIINLSNGDILEAKSTYAKVTTNYTSTVIVEGEVIYKRFKSTVYIFYDKIETIELIQEDESSS